MNCRIVIVLMFLVLWMKPVLALMGTVPDDNLVKKGEYIARLGDCVACHTSKDGKSMAGGLAFTTPMGVMYSTNITPDVKTGIGRYTFEQFDRAIRQGVAADGHNLYPSMPYTSFAKIGPEDMRALYAYMMQGVQPVYQENLENRMKWPFSMRFGIKFWNMFFLDDTPYKVDGTQSPQWNRGAYIVQGLGHCGSCHTPRGIVMQEKALSQEGDSGHYYLAGASIEGWHAVSLRNYWKPTEMEQFLKVGHNSHATAYGAMTDVIHFSTQGFSDADLAAVSTYLSTLPPDRQTEVIKPKPTKVALDNDLYKTRGGLGYVQFCSSCHGVDGLGVDYLFPPLASNSSVLSKDPTSVIHVVLSGGKSAETQQEKRAYGMPSFSGLSNQELSEIISFLRTQWGNQSDLVSGEEIQTVRDQIPQEPTPLTKFVTPRFADMLSRPNADQLIYGMRLLANTKYLLPNYVGNSLNCNNCHLNGGTVGLGAPYVGVSAQFPSYRPRSGRVIDFKDRVNSCFQRSMNGHVLDKGSKEMLAMIAYMENMKTDAKPGQPIPGRGVGKISQTIIPNLINGFKIYKDQCAVCHGNHGEGKKKGDGQYVFPPLWGLQSFNLGAGMARTYTAAAFVKNNMPISNTLKFPLGQGGLTDQQAVDVAEYFTHMPRPDFAKKSGDWPHGGKPNDSRY